MASRTEAAGAESDHTARVSGEGRGKRLGASISDFVCVRLSWVTVVVED